MADLIFVMIPKYGLKKHTIQYVMVFYCTTMFVLWPLSGTFPTSSSYTTPNVNISVFLGPALLFRGPALTALCLTFAFFLACCFCNMSADWCVFWRNFGFIFAFRRENRKTACDKFKPVFTSWKQNRFNIFRAIAFVLLSLIFCLLFLILKQNNFLGNHYINPSVDCCLSAGLCLFCDVIWAHVTAQCSFRFRK